jgi:hypothetical protein
MDIMPTIQTRIVKAVNSDLNSCWFNFEIRNLSRSKFFVLKRGTPLEGLKSDCLVVILNGERVTYDGYVFKRGIPKEEEFVLIHPNETISHQFDLSTAYSIRKPGIYSISFDESKLVVLPGDVPKENLPKLQGGRELVRVENTPEKESVDEARTVGRTFGETVRESNKKKADSRGFSQNKGLIEPLIEGATERQKQQILKAHQNGYQYAVSGLAGLQNNGSYKQWFGIFSHNNFSIVESNFSSIVNGMQNTQFTYVLDGNECEDDDYGYTVTGSSTIWLCAAFWTAGSNGLNSQAGTIVHEHSHASAYTEDIAYNLTSCKSLAMKSPHKAIRNADSYEYYCETFSNKITRVIVSRNEVNG